MNREAIYSALWAKLQAIEGFKLTSRRLQHWADVERRVQPALFMAQTGESAQTTTGAPTRWTLKVSLYIYVHASMNQPPGPIINPLLDAVCNAVNALHPVTGRSALGVDGVQWCRVDGDIATDEGTLGDQAVAIVPVTILAT
jgi:hypothetical protein